MALRRTFFKYFSLFALPFIKQLSRQTPPSPPLPPLPPLPSASALPLSRRQLHIRQLVQVQVTVLNPRPQSISSPIIK